MLQQKRTIAGSVLVNIDLFLNLNGSFALQASNLANSVKNRIGEGKAVLVASAMMQADPLVKMFEKTFNTKADRLEQLCSGSAYLPNNLNASEALLFPQDRFADCTHIIGLTHTLYYGNMATYIAAREGFPRVPEKGAIMNSAAYMLTYKPPTIEEIFTIAQ